MMALDWWVTVSKKLKIYYDYTKLKPGGGKMATNKRVFTLRLSDDVFDKIGMLATREHRSMTNYIEYILLKYLEETEKAEGPVESAGSDLLLPI